MASIDRPDKNFDGGKADNTTKTGTVDKKQLEQTRRDLIGKIKSIQTKYPERSKLTEEAKTELRRLYSQLMRTCRKLAEGILADFVISQDRALYSTTLVFYTAPKQIEEVGN